MKMIDYINDFTTHLKAGIQIANNSSLKSTTKEFKEYAWIDPEIVQIKGEDGKLKKRTLGSYQGDLVGKVGAGKPFVWHRLDVKTPYFQFQNMNHSEICK